VQADASVYTTQRKKEIVLTSLLKFLLELFEYFTFCRRSVLFEPFERNNFARQENGKLSSPPLVPGTALIQQSRSFFFIVRKFEKEKNSSARMLTSESLRGKTAQG
jgi:hypothetical protein